MPIRICERSRKIADQSTLLSGANSMAKWPSTSRLSVSAPALSRTRAASPWPSEIAIVGISIGYPSSALSSLPWCNALCPEESVALRGLLFSRRRCMRGTDPIAAARCMGSCPRRSLTRTEAPCSTSFRAMSRLLLDTQKWIAVCEVSS